MNKKRWMALAIALVILITSSITSFIQMNRDQAEVMQLGKSIVEEVIEPGSSREKILTIPIHGVIIHQSPTKYFAGGNETYQHDFVLKQLEEAKNNPKIKAVVLVVDSPGGTVYAAEHLHKKILDFKQESKKPVYVSMTSVAASGGYYISAPADKIFASPETVTGSLGVIMSTYDLSGLQEKLGVKSEVVKSGELKDMGATSHGMTAKEKEVFESHIMSAYDRFVDVIAQGRGMKPERVKELADGRIYTGRQAKENGLIDELGYLEDALKALRQDYHLEKASVVSFKASPFTWSDFSSMLSQASVKLRQNLFEDLVLSRGLIQASPSNQLPLDPPQALYLYGGE